MKIGSLFSGYGGLDMGVQLVIGGDVAWHVEYDDPPSRILAHHWAQVPNYGDVTTANWIAMPPVEVITAGYPCQPFSMIGKRKGKDDVRHLWPYVATAIRVLRPRLAVLENVAGHLTLGFGTVLGDLAEIGYDTRWVCLPASAAGAPHRRERIFIAAYPKDQPWRFSDGDGLRAGRTKGHELENAGAGATPDAYNLGSNESRPTRNGRLESSNARTPDAVWGDVLPAIRHWEDVTGRNAPWPGHDGGGVSTEFTEWLMGIPAGHVTSAAIGLSREQQARAIGNGVVPQQAALALRHLLTPEASEAVAV